MRPPQDDVESLARAIDRIVFHEGGSAPGPEASAGSLAMISYLNDSFPLVTPPSGRRDRVQRRLIRALGIRRSSPAGWGKLEAELNRRLGNLDHRWTPVVGGAALLVLGVVGLAFWRQRGGVKPASAALR
ncbi:MAG TPA: hypothetical protein VIT43_10245 [Candidatus Dormibacteraeota bacterium]